MFEMTLTSFVDVTAKTGLAKTNAILRLKEQHEAGYQPAHDYYKRIREGLIQYHQKGKMKSQFPTVDELTSNKGKIPHYAAILAGYQGFLEDKQFEWFNPFKAEWTYDKLVVKINPELGLVINGKPHVIKLYFKVEPLSKTKANLVLFLMDKELPRQRYGQDITYAILDTRHGNLILPSGDNRRKLSLQTLQGEAAYIETVWKNS